jgi:branched-chain amino acid transport system permease protein
MNNLWGGDLWGGDLWRSAGLRGLILIGLALAALLAVPLVADRYLLSVLTLIFYFAYVGQAWNLMMGYAGQLSLGHALYVGLGGYVSALLWLKLGIGPWLGVFPAVAVASAAGAAIGWLGFRFGIAGVYFALLTIAFAEFTRIGFDHLEITGGAAGLFLPFEEKRLGEWWNLRGGQLMFYYLALALAAGAALLVALLARSRLGYQWRAVREDEAAAQALGINAFAVKMAAVVISSAMTAVGGVFYAFYYNNLFPSQVFEVSRSIELILAPIVGGLGTVFGPVIGAFLLTPLGEVLIAVMERLGVNAPGVKAIFYGVILIAIISLMPSGVWPRLAALLRLKARAP